MHLYAYPVSLYIDSERFAFFVRTFEPKYIRNESKLLVRIAQFSLHSMTFVSTRPASQCASEKIPSNRLAVAQHLSRLLVLNGPWLNGEWYLIRSRKRRRTNKSTRKRKVFGFIPDEWILRLKLWASELTRCRPFEPLPCFCPCSHPKRPIWLCPSGPAFQVGWWCCRQPWLLQTKKRNRTITIDEEGPTFEQAVELK